MTAHKYLVSTIPNELWNHRIQQVFHLVELEQVSQLNTFLYNANCWVVKNKF